MKPLPPQLQAALQTAARAFHAGDHRRTQTLCLELLRRAGPRPDVLNLKGLSELHAGQSEAAANSLRAALKLEPRRAELHLNLALAESELARWRAVKQHALEAARLAPQQPRVVYQAARCCRDAQDFATAQRLADRAAALAPDEPDGWHLKGSIHLDLGDMSAAKAAFARAVEADPQHARSLALLSSLEKTGTDDTARIGQ